MMEDKEATHHDHLKFWLGKFLNPVSFPDFFNYPGALRTGVHSHVIWPKESALTPYYEAVLQEVKYGERNQYFHWTDFKKVTAKKLYQLNTTTFPPPAITYKRDIPDWELVWKRVGSVMLEPRGREVIYQIVNNLFPTQERLFLINKDRPLERRRVTTSRCKRCNQGVLEDCQHLFTECSMIREGWGWLRLRLLQLMPDVTTMSNWEFLHLVFPCDGRVEKEMMWLLGQWVQLVVMESIIRGRKLEQRFVMGHLRYKYLESRKMKIPQLNYISDVTVIFDPG